MYLVLAPEDITVKPLLGKVVTLGYVGVNLKEAMSIQLALTIKVVSCSQELDGRTHSSLNVDSLDVVPALLEQGSQEVE